MSNYNSDLEKQYEGFSKVSRAFEAQDDSQFEKLSFALKRTKSNNVYNVGRPPRGQALQAQRRFSYNDKFSYQTKNDSIILCLYPLYQEIFYQLKMITICY